MRGMTAAAGLLALAAPLLTAGRGAAEPCASGTGPLLAEVALRVHLAEFPTTPAERKEKRDLAKVQRLLKRRSRSYSKDARTEATAGGLLLALYPADATIESDLGGAMDGLRADLGMERDDLQLMVPKLPAGPLRDSAVNGVSAADAALAASDADDPADVPSRTGHLGDAARSLEQGFHGALTGPDRRRRRTCGDEMWDRENGNLVWRADRVIASYQSSTRNLVLDGIRARSPAGDSELEIDVQNVFGTGSYPLAYASGRWVENSFVYYGIVAGGTVTVTSWDPANGLAEGTFTLDARGCMFDCSVVKVTGGTFRIRNLVAR